MADGTLASSGGRRVLLYLTDAQRPVMEIRHVSRKMPFETTTDETLIVTKLFLRDPRSRYPCAS